MLIWLLFFTHLSVLDLQLFFFYFFELFILLICSYISLYLPFWDLFLFICLLYKEASFTIWLFIARLLIFKLIFQPNCRFKLFDSLNLPNFLMDFSCFLVVSLSIIHSQTNKSRSLSFPNLSLSLSFSVSAWGKSMHTARRKFGATFGCGGTCSWQLVVCFALRCFWGFKWFSLHANCKQLTALPLSLHSISLSLAFSVCVWECVYGKHRSRARYWKWFFNAALTCRAFTHILSHSVSLSLSLSYFPSRPSPPFASLSPPLLLFAHAFRACPVKSFCGNFLFAFPCFPFFFLIFPSSISIFVQFEVRRGVARPPRHLFAHAAELVVI